MANCGCTDTVPCGTQECGCKFEVDAGCVRYTGTELSCIDSNTGDRLSDILLDLNAKFCNLIEGNYIEVSQELAGVNCDEGGLKIVVKNINTAAIINTEYLCSIGLNSVQSVTGLNTDNTDPKNPIIKISVDGTTITGIGTPASPLVATSTPYSLPTASPTTLGGVKVGTGLNIDGAGILSTTYTNLQKEITTSNYVLTDADNDYTIFINNNTTTISISLGAITIANFSVGFIQEGTADVTFVGVTNPVGLKLKGQGYQAFIERKLSTSTYYLLGNTKV